MVIKYFRDEGGISMSVKEEENYESDTRNDTDPTQVDDKYPLQYWVGTR